LKRLNINITTTDVFHPVDKLGTFDRSQLRTLFLQLNAVASTAADCAEQCQSIPNDLVELGLDDLDVSPPHLRNYYERVEAEAVSLSDAVANRLQASASTAHMQDGFVRHQFYKAFEISNKFGSNQYSGIRSRVLDAIDNLPVTGLGHDDSTVEVASYSPCTPRPEPAHAKYSALVSTAVVLEAFNTALRKFKAVAVASLDMPCDQGIHDEAKALLYGAEL